jgi:hypothetical protein
VVPMTLFKNRLGSWVFPRPGNLELGEVPRVLEGASLRWRFEGVDAIMTGGAVRLSVRPCPTWGHRDDILCRGEGRTELGAD